MKCFVGLEWNILSNYEDFTCDDKTFSKKDNFHEYGPTEVVRMIFNITFSNMTHDRKKSDVGVEGYLT